MDYLKRLEQKKNELELSLKRDELNASKMERRARTRRLIQKGALLEKYLESEHLSEVETEELLQIFANYINEKKPDKFKKETK